jgi:hypothetical protein
MRVIIRTIMPAVAVALTAGTLLAAPRLLQDLTGTWAFAVVTENGTGTPTVVIRQSAGKIAGTYESRMMGQRNIAGVVKGDSVLFTLEANGPDGVALDFKGVVVNKDSLAGTVDFGGMGGAAFSAKRQR